MVGAAASWGRSVVPQLLKTRDNSFCHVFRKGWNKWGWEAPVLKYKGKAYSRTLETSRRYCKDESFFAFRLWVLQIIVVWILVECGLMFLLSGQWGLKIPVLHILRNIMKFKYIVTYVTEVQVYLHLILAFEENVMKIISSILNISKLIMSGMPNLTEKPLQQEVPSWSTNKLSREKREADCEVVYRWKEMRCNNLLKSMGLSKILFQASCKYMTIGKI